jgi:membrane associated rhomboid family serine protease
VIELLRDLHKDEADLFSLTLSASAIAHRVVQYRKDLFGLWVEKEDVNQAVETIREYMNENQTSDGREVGEGSSQARSFAGIWAAVALMAFHLIVAGGGYKKEVLGTYASSARHILQGEVWRTVTALSLHSNVLHLAGNMVGIALFGSAVCGIAGWGMGAVMILVSGAVGNWANAGFYETGHVSIGASTAVFGALGILAAHQFLTKIKYRQERVRAWLPLAGGLALLAILGSGAGSDIMAHLFGFVAGIVLGVVYALIGKRPRRFGQSVALGVFFILLVGAWVVPTLLAASG